MNQKKIDKLKEDITGLIKKQYLTNLKEIRNKIKNCQRAIKELEKEMTLNNISFEKYNPAIKIDKRTSGFDYWQQISYEDNIVAIQKIKITRYKCDYSWVNNFIDHLHLLDSVFKDRWDIISSNQIAIYYDEVEIKNNTTKRLLKDLYVIIKLDLESNSIAIEGCRATLFADEAISSYRHSHLPGRNTGEISYFCLGNGPLSSTIVLLKEDCNEDIFTAFLYEIDNFVRWESLQGVPYVKMRTIRESNEIADPNSIIQDSYTYQKLKKVLKSKDLKWNIIGDNINLIVTEELEDLITPNLDDYKKVYKVNEVSYVKETVMRNYPSTKMFNFRGKSIKFNVLIEKVKDEYKAKEYPHPGVTNYIKQRLESEARDYLYKKTTSSRDGSENISSNIKEVTESNLVTV